VKTLLAVLISSFFMVLNPSAATADTSDHHLVDCPESPTPGKRPAGTGCAIVARKVFRALPDGPIVIRVEIFSSVTAAQASESSAGAVVEAAGKVWLVTVATQGKRSSGGSFVTEIGPLPEIPRGNDYELQVSDANFGPSMNPAISKAIHTHSGPEVWYVLTGAQCLETPNGVTRAKAGEGMFVDANIPMQLNIAGDSSREAIFMIVHDASKPATTLSQWRAKGLCKR
jgi:mannose-6-phosphate isomerase-like protein (cupin superfamily)